MVFLILLALPQLSVTSKPLDEQPNLLVAELIVSNSKALAKKKQAKLSAIRAHAA